ncbi:hypothetical protein PAXRUDRAFT_823769, partial [Paxillus rubicundulus Ve08.2h10]
KVTCTVIYGQHVAREQQLDQEHISTGQRDSPRDPSAITGALGPPPSSVICVTVICTTPIFAQNQTET